MNYRPRKGSALEKAIQIIQDFGQPIPGMLMADMAGIDKRSLFRTLQISVRHGDIERVLIAGVLHYQMQAKQPEPMSFVAIPPSEWGPPGKPYEPEKRRRS